MPSRTSLSLSLCTLLLGVLAGCTGRGEVVIFDLVEQPIPLRAETDSARPLRVAVWPPTVPGRAQLWSREHIWGGKTYYTVPGGNVPAAVGLTMVKRFREAGWQAWIEAPGDGEPSGNADVTISGELRALEASAVSYLGRTKLSASFRMVVTVRNASDGSTVRMRLKGNGDNRVFWFEGSDIKDLLRDIVHESLDKFLAETTVDNRAIRRHAIN